MSMVSTTGGLDQSICTSDLSTAFTNLRQFIFAMTTSYVLNGAPVVSTIQVTMNGQVVPNDANNGWTYDPSTNTVWLHGSYITATNAHVNVTYTNANAKS